MNADTNELPPSASPSQVENRNGCSVRQAVDSSDCMRLHCLPFDCNSVKRARSFQGAFPNTPVLAAGSTAALGKSFAPARVDRLRATAAANRTGPNLAVRPRHVLVPTADAASAGQNSVAVVVDTPAAADRPVDADNPAGNPVPAEQSLAAASAEGRNHACSGSPDIVHHYLAVHCSKRRFRVVYHAPHLVP